MISIRANQAVAAALVNSSEARSRARFRAVFKSVGKSLALKVTFLGLFLLALWLYEQLARV